MVKYHRPGCRRKGIPASSSCAQVAESGRVVPSESLPATLVLHAFTQAPFLARLFVDCFGTRRTEFIPHVTTAFRIADRSWGCDGDPMGAGLSEQPYHPSQGTAAFHLSIPVGLILMRGIARIACLSLSFLNCARLLTEYTPPQRRPRGREPNRPEEPFCL